FRPFVSQSCPSFPEGRLSRHPLELLPAIKCGRRRLLLAHQSEHIRSISRRGNREIIGRETALRRRRAVSPAFAPEPEMMRGCSDLWGGCSPKDREEGEGGSQFEKSEGE